MKIYECSTDAYFISNCFFAIDEKTKHGFLIDAGCSGSQLADMIRKNGWTIEYLLVTHGHADHIAGIRELQDEFGMEVIAHSAGREYLEDPAVNLSVEYGEEIILEDVRYIEDGEVISLKAAPECSLKAIYVPGHTEDSILYYDEADGAAFVGDSIYKDAPGDWEYPRGDRKGVLGSIRNIILKLPGDTELYTGHSEPTTIDAERHLYEGPDAFFK